MWQRAKDVKTGYWLWVKVGPPQHMNLRGINDEKRIYEEALETEFYETNILNPVPDARYPRVFMPQSVIELVAEFAETVLDDPILST